MSNNMIKFSATSLVGTGKQGVIAPDQDGYYTLPIGGLNVHNSAGMHYDLEGARQLFEDKSSQLQRRVKRGALRSEVGHPKWKAGQSESSFLERVLTIEETNVCAHISDVWLDFTNFKNPDGSPMVGIMGKVCGSGPHGEMLEKAMNNPKENVCFSIRSFTDDYLKAGRTHRILKNVITFDYVNEPGIAIAEKYKSPALESFQETVFNEKTFDSLKDRLKVTSTANESALLTLDEVCHSFGWSGLKPTTNRFNKW